MWENRYLCVCHNNVSQHWLRVDAGNRLFTLWGWGGLHLSSSKSCQLSITIHPLINNNVTQVNEGNPTQCTTTRKEHGIQERNSRSAWVSVVSLEGHIFTSDIQTSLVHWRHHLASWTCKYYLQLRECIRSYLACCPGSYRCMSHATYVNKNWDTYELSWAH